MVLVVVTISVIVTTGRGEASDWVACFVFSSIISIGCVVGRSGKVSSGSVLPIFVFFAFGQCFRQCPSVSVHLRLLMLLLLESFSLFIFSFSSSILIVTDPTTLLLLVSSMVSCADSRISEGPGPGSG